LAIVSSFSQSFKFGTVASLRFWPPPLPVGTLAAALRTARPIACRAESMVTMFDTPAAEAPTTAEVDAEFCDDNSNAAAFTA